MTKLRFWKYIICFFLLLACAVAVSAAEDAASNTTYTLDEDGTLTVYCEGICYGVDLSEEEWGKVKTIVFTEGVTEIWDEALGAYWNYAPMMRYTSVTLPEGLEKIGDYAFMSVETLTEVHLPDSLTGIGYGAFAECNITELTIPKGITSLAGAEFCGNPLTSVTFHENFTELGDFALSGTALETVELPDSLTKIGAHAFSHCGKLRSVTIPEGVTEIGAYAFWGCRALKEMVLPSTLAAIHGTFVWEAGPELRITLPAGSDSFLIEEDVLYTADKATLVRYPAYKKETSFAVPQSVTEISHMAFYGCKNLEEILLPDGLKTIGGMAFSGCDALQKITVPESVEEFGLVGAHGGVPDYFGIGYGPANAFYESGLREIVVLSRIANAILWYQGQVWLPEGVTLYCYEYSATDLGDKEARAEYEIAQTDDYTVRYLEEDHEHIWTEKILRDPTCAIAGSKRLTCSVCGGAFREVIPTLEHTYGGTPEMYRSSDTNEEYVIYKCTVCGDRNRIKVLDIEHEHEWTDTVLQTPTCTRKGERYRTCSVCNKVTFESIPMIEHILGEPKTISPTCKRGGEKYAYCTVCAQMKILERTPRLSAHTFGELQVLTPATCIEEGKGQRECVDCGFVQEEALPIAGHTCDAWTQTLAPALFTTGREEGVCTVCGETVVRSVPKLTFIQFITPYVYILDALLVVILLVLLLRKKKS